MQVTGEIDDQLVDPWLVVGNLESKVSGRVDQEIEAGGQKVETGGG